MRHQLKAKTPSARARMSYILRADRYGVNQARAAELVAAGVANLPNWADGPAGFWSAVDGFERKNSRLCLELELNLPRELSRERQVAAVADYIDRLTAAAGAFPITWAIHDSDDGNPHVHLMLQERALDGRARGPREHFKRANSKNPEQGGVVKSRWWHRKESVFWSRALWADACNQQLLAAGQAPRFDARRKSVRLDEALRAGDLRAAAALCSQTERHEGVKVAAARRKLEAGRVQVDELPERVMQIINGNDCARHYNGWLRDWARTASEKELSLFLADHLHDLHQTLAVEMQGTHIEARAAWLEKQHAAALAENAARTAELSELLADEQAHQTADRQAAQRELAELVASEQQHHATDLEHLADRQALGRHDARVVQAQARLASLPTFAFDPDPTPEERHADKLAQARADWLAAYPVRAWLGLVPAAVSQDAIDRARREADRARAAAVAAADERERQIEDARARLTAWLELAEQYRRERWPVPEPLQVAQEQPSTAVLRDSLQALQEAEPERVVWEEHGHTLGGLDGEDVTYLYDESADDWEQVLQEPDPDDTPAPRGPRMR